MSVFVSYITILVAVLITTLFEMLAAGGLVVQVPYAAWIFATAAAAIFGAFFGALFYYGYFGPPAAAVSPAPFIAIFFFFSVMVLSTFHILVLNLAIRQNSLDLFLTQVPVLPFYLAQLMRWPVFIIVIVAAPTALLGYYKWASFSEAKKEVLREAKRMVKETGAIDVAAIRDRLTVLPFNLVGRIIYQMLPSLIKYDYSVREWWINHIKDNPELAGLPPRL